MTESPVAIHASSPRELEERVAAERRGAPFLVYRDGGGHQQLIDLEKSPPRLTIGRRPGNDISLTWDFAVSRVHAVLERIGDTWTLVDDGLSRHGSYINGRRPNGRQRLHGGDLLRFGGTAMLYCVPRPDSSITGPEEHLPVAGELTGAQRRVLVALCRPYGDPSGYSAPASNKAIADELFISVDAVKGHMRTLFQLFDVGDLPQNEKRARLAERALNTGVVTPREL